MIIIFQRHFRIEVSPLGQTQRRWKYPRCGCVCVKEPWLSFYTMALQLLQFMGAGLNQPETWSLSMFWQRTLPQCPNCLLDFFLQCFLNRLVVPVSSCFNGFFLVVSEAPWHNNPRDIVNIVGSGAFAALCWDQSKAAVGWTPSQYTLESTWG